MGNERTVKAAVMREFGRLQVETFPYPEVDKDSMVVAIILAGICGTDKHLFEGKNKDAPLPMILGHENIARIDKIGERASEELEVTGKKLSVGDRITWFGAIPCGKCWYCRWVPQNHPGILCTSPFAYGQTSCEVPPHLFGGYAEKVFIKPGVWVWKIPDEIPDKAALLVDIFASVGGVIRAMEPYASLKEGFGPADVVAVQGAGPIGIAAGMTAKLCGAHKIILVGAPRHRLDLAKKLGMFDHFINIEEVTDAKERVALVKKWSPGGVGPDLVVDCTGVPEAVPEGIDMVRRGGTFVEIGSFVDTGEVTINPFKHICWKDITIIGQFGCPPHYYDRCLKFVEMGLKQGWPLEKMVTHIFPLDKAQEAMETGERLEGMKIALHP